VEGFGQIIQNQGPKLFFYLQNAKLDCIKGESRTSRDKQASSLEREVVSTRGLHDRTQIKSKISEPFPDS
jgi:hypothetical protein